MIIISKFYFVKDCGITMSRTHSYELGLRPEINNSWPSAVFITFQYKGYHNLTNSNVTTEVTFQSNCTGTLINSDTVLTAASCIVNYFDHWLNGTWYSISVEANECYPSIESMYTIYAGVNDINQSFLNQTFIQQRSVWQIIAVSED